MIIYTYACIYTDQFKSLLGIVSPTKSGEVLVAKRFPNWDNFRVVVRDRVRVTAGEGL